MRTERKNLRMIAWVALIVFFVVMVRMFYLQIVKAEHFQEKVVEQRVKVINQKAERGQIIDRNGNILAMSLLANDIEVYPKFIMQYLTKDERKEMANILSKNLSLSYKDVLATIQTKDEWAVVAKRVDPEITDTVKKELKEAKLSYVGFSRSPKRYYPNGDLASSILGFVNHENEAGAGIEVSMSQYLDGVSGYTIAETYNKEKIIPIGFNNTSSPIDGQNVQLTTDNYIQHIIEQRLKQTVEELNPVSMHVVAMNPKTGEVLGMSSYPSYDPNHYEDYSKKDWTTNAGSFVYEPGSTFKPVYMAMAMDQGAINKDSSWYDGAGSINIQGTRIKNWDSRPLGQMTLKDIIINSSNVGMIEISKTMTSEQIVSGLKKAGIGVPTGIELPGEEMGLIPSAKTLDSDPLMKATESFGQGIATTPIQLVTAFSEVINGGFELDPKIVKEVKDDFGNILYENELKHGERKYKASTSESIKSYLKANMVVGSGKSLQIEGYDGGGKTGSAWKVENGVYKSGAIIGSFMGFAPYDDPEIALLVVVDEPDGAEFGSTSAGPTWHDIMEEILRYESVPKVDQKEEKEIEVPDVKWMTYENAKSTLETKIKDVKVNKSGKGEVVEDVEYSFKNNTLYVTLLMKKMIVGKTLYMPILQGKTEEEVRDLFEPYNVSLKFHGEGKVAEQNINYGMNMLGKEIIFWLK